MLARRSLTASAERLVVDETLDGQLLESLERVFEDFLALGVLLVKILQVTLGLGFELLDAVGGVDFLVEFLALLGLDITPGDANESIALGFDRRALVDQFGIERLDVREELVLEHRQVGLALLLVDRGDDGGREVEDLL
jgi:hypothetical protein